jgi:hypothetical protein
MQKKFFLKGVTFIETVVTVGILSVVMLGSSLFFVRMWRIHGFAMEMGVASFVANRGVENAVENIRRARQAENGAFPIVQADDHDLTFYEDYDGDGDIERVHYFVDDQKFKIGVTEPDFTGMVPTYPNGDQIVKEAANYIVNENAGMPTFEYYDENGMIFAYNDVDGIALSTPATPSDIKMVKILLFVNPDPLRAPNNVRIQSFVVIRNLTKFDELPT